MASRACLAVVAASSSSRGYVLAFGGGSLRSSSSTVGIRTLSTVTSRSTLMTSYRSTIVGGTSSLTAFANNNGASRIPINSITQLRMSSTEATPTKTTTAPSSSSVSPRRVKTNDAKVSEEQVSIKGWVRTVRKQKTLAFVEVNDGSSMSGIQCVLPFDNVDEDTMKGKRAFIIYCILDLN